jgi:RNA-directed DNA polymerase
MKPDWKIDSPICTVGCTVEHIGHNPQDESIYRRLTGDNVRWASQHWKTKSFNRLWVTILNQIFEVDFKGFSYGFRPGRSPHQALDALTVGIQWKRVNWVLDADIRGFFDNMSHEWTMKFIEHRVADRRVLRLIQKWLQAGVSEDGQWSETKLGTPQGAVVSPLLANVYLHYAFDQWVEV